MEHSCVKRVGEWLRLSRGLSPATANAWEGVCLCVCKERVYVEKTRKKKELVVHQINVYLCIECVCVCVCVCT